MGLTVHFQWQLNNASDGAARRIVERLRQQAEALSFAAIGPLISINADSGDEVWPIWVEDIERDGTTYDVPPSRGYYFRARPGRGTETTCFGLLRYPKTIVLPNGRRTRTNFSGWSWRDFCKTQYASNPRYGGVENFLRAHVALIELLDFACEFGLKTKVRDEGHYAEKRDTDAFRREIGEWNSLVAGLVGTLKDALPGRAEAPILDYPNFERLEAERRLKSSSSGC
jgi:hypothetical protein